MFQYIPTWRYAAMKIIISLIALEIHLDPVLIIGLSSWTDFFRVVCSFLIWLQRLSYFRLSMCWCIHLMYLWGKPLGLVRNWPHNSDDYLYEVKRLTKKHTQIATIPFLGIDYTCRVTFSLKAVKLPCNRVIFRWYEIPYISNKNQLSRDQKICDIRF